MLFAISNTTTFQNIEPCLGCRLAVISSATKRVIGVFDNSKADSNLRQGLEKLWVIDLNSIEDLTNLLGQENNLVVTGCSVEGIDYAIIIFSLALSGGVQ